MLNEKDMKLCNKKYTKRQLELMVSEFNIKMKNTLTKNEYDEFVGYITKQLENDLSNALYLKSIQRTKRNLTHLINDNTNKYNSSVKILTLAFDNKTNDIRYANNEFKKFIKRLRYYLKINEMNNKFEYICIPKYHSSSLYYEVMFFDLPYLKIKTIQTIWTNWVVSMNKLSKHSILSLVDYLFEDTQINENMKNKRFFCSRGIKK